MHYTISRNGQTYGPYTLDDLQRYVASGNVLPTDMAKSEEMVDWVPVSQLLAPNPIAAQPPADPGFSSPGYANPAYSNVNPNPAYGQPNPVAASPYQDPPNINWGLLLLLDVITCTLFQWVWNLIIAAWLKRVQPNATSLYYYLGAAVLTLIQIAVAVPHGMHQTFGGGIHTSYDPVSGIIGLCVWVVRLIARYSQRASLEEHFNTVEPVGLQLNPVMTFFFGGIYFQYHLNRINQMKQGARFGAGRSF